MESRTEKKSRGLALSKDEKKKERKNKKAAVLCMKAAIVYK